ncbi:acyl-CoA dehydrogenase family protein [Lysinibacillus sp. KU-BSD001]|uniref:acyl-CoA dehydrogenase family protein n=1 Tax=Lysinibacillus sp. KU-BSD001 TaxID=3141328 RepID=UPI0036E7176B
MEFRLTEEQKMVQETIRQFVKEELIPLEDEVLKNEQEGRPGLPPEKLKELQFKAKEMGFWGIDTPEEYGGAGLDPMLLAIVLMELGKTFVPFAFGGSADNILYYTNEEQKKRYLIPTINGEKTSCFAMIEPNSGSNKQNIQMTAVKDGNEWVLHGEKTWITDGHEADFVMVIAVTDKEAYEKTGRDGVTCFLVDREMGWTSKVDPTTGEGNPVSLVFQHVRVPEENILGDVHGGYNLGLEWVSFARWVASVRAIGAAEHLLQMAIDYSKERETFSQPIAEHQAMQQMMENYASDIEAAKRSMLNATFTLDKEGDNKHVASMAKLPGAAIGSHVVDSVLQIYGDIYTKELPMDRWYREARLWRIYEGADENQHTIIARNLVEEQVKIGQYV